MNELEKLLTTASDRQLQELIRQFEEQHASHPDPRVRRAAERAIERARGEQDVRALLRALRERRPPGRPPDQQD